MDPIIVSPIFLALLFTRLTVVHLEKVTGLNDLIKEKLKTFYTGCITLANTMVMHAEQGEAS